MTQEIEIEFKNIVTKEEFDTLCKSFSIEAFTKQVNHYFETPDFSLKEAGSALRIRHKGETYTLTLKQPAEIGLLETHQVVTEDEAKMMMETNTIIQGAVVDRLHKLQIPVSALTYMGSLTTEEQKHYLKAERLSLIIVSITITMIMKLNLKCKMKKQEKLHLLIY